MSPIPWKVEARHWVVAANGETVCRTEMPDDAQAIVESVNATRRAREVSERILEQRKQFASCRESKGAGREPSSEPAGGTKDPSHHEDIVCPKCNQVTLAEVIHTIPFWSYAHECEHCKYLIGESEWQTVKPRTFKKP